MADQTTSDQKKSPLREITQPFIDLFHAPRALWGINLAYVIEGMCYFGMLGYLAIYFSDFVFQAVEHADEWSHNMVMVLTAGITIAMFFLGFVADRWGVRFALITAFVFMLIGRTVIACAPSLMGLEPTRPGVFVGDTVSLHVTKIDTEDGNKAITRATVIANDKGGADAVTEPELDLAGGEGVAPNQALESRVVWLGKAKLVKGKDQEWQVQYGAAPVTAPLLVHSAEALGLRAGASISLNRAYLFKRENKKTKEDEFVIRSHWLEDVTAVDTFPPDLSEGDGIEPNASIESWRVQLSEVTLVEGDGWKWKVKYGRRPVTARLLIVSAEDPALRAGAVISLNRATVIRPDEEGDEFAIRVKWPEDVAAVDTTGCTEQGDGTQEINKELILDVAVGEGIAPDASIVSRTVQLGKATVVEGEGREWLVRYGRGSVTARLLLDSTEEPLLGMGAMISLCRADVIKGEEVGAGFILRARWPEDVAAVDTFGCVEAPYRTVVAAREKALRSDSRWPIAEETQAVRDAKPVTIDELRDMEDGSQDVLLRDVHVTYVRNGGYFLQSEENGPAIFTFVNPVGSPLHLVTMLGILFVVIGYGMYQPAAYAGVRQFTTPKTAAMGFAMLYALMNLGGWLPTFAFLLRDDDFLDLGISGTYAFYAACTLLGLLCTVLVLTRKTVARSVAAAKAESEAIEKAEKEKKDEEASDSIELQPCPHKSCDEKNPVDAKRCRRCGRDLESFKKTDASAAESDKSATRLHIPLHMWLITAALVGAVYWRVSAPWCHWVAAAIALVWIALCTIPVTARFLAKHPLADGKFCFFIFALIPVQTLFTYNWLILPQYISRSFEGWIGEYFEIAANANPILIFIAVPLIASASRKANVYNMMICGTFVMAAPAFLMVIGPYTWTLALYILIMTIGEAMWQPRFLQYAAEIAPEGRTGQYMGVAQLPWFLTKVLVPALYSGWMLERYCPSEGSKDTEFMWLIFACIAMTSTVILFLAKPWIGKDFKTEAD